LADQSITREVVQKKKFDGGSADVNMDKQTRLFSSSSISVLLALPWSKLILEIKPQYLP
jgi:hypothetical protein